MSTHSTTPSDLIRTIEKDDLNSFLDDMDRLQCCVAGIGEAMEMTNPNRMRSESSDLLDQSNIASGLSSILKVCANEMRINLEQLQKQFSPIPEDNVKADTRSPLVKCAGPVIEFAPATEEVH